jgi:hypothetical protein
MNCHLANCEETVSILGQNAKMGSLDSYESWTFGCENSISPRVRSVAAESNQKDRDDSPSHRETDCRPNSQGMAAAWR